MEFYYTVEKMSFAVPDVCALVGEKHTTRAERIVLKTNKSLLHALIQKHNFYRKNIGVLSTATLAFNPDNMEFYYSVEKMSFVVPDVCALVGEKHTTRAERIVLKANKSFPHFPSEAQFL